MSCGVAWPKALSQYGASLKRLCVSVPGASSLSLVSLETETTGCVGALAVSTTLNQASPKLTLWSYTYALLVPALGQEEGQSLLGQEGLPPLSNLRARSTEKG